jgi:arabinose-5-phosphate isomerase
MHESKRNSDDLTASSPAELVRIEAEALQRLADRLDGEQQATFEAVASLLATGVREGKRTVLTGVGKSGYVARKTAATLVSTGTPAQFMHPSEALHGDLGMLNTGDVLIALSYSGETDELLQLLPLLPKLEVTLISFCGCSTSSLALASKHVLDISVEREACNHQLAPTASTTAMLALGDALAIDVSRRLNFQPRQFAALHPGGHLGRRLVQIRQLMHIGDAMPSVSPSASMPEIIHEMSAKRLGMTTISASGQLLGILSDGDLRRLFERQGPQAYDKTAAEVMNPRPRTIRPDTFAADALQEMEEHKITVLPVTEDGTCASPLLGVVHFHDLWEVSPQPLRQQRQHSEVAD